MLAGRRYKTRSALYQCLFGIPKTDYAAAFRSWIERLELCVKVNGDYFKALNNVIRYLLFVIVSIALVSE